MTPHPDAPCLAQNLNQRRLAAVGKPHESPS